MLTESMNISLGSICIASTADCRYVCIWEPSLAKRSIFCSSLSPILRLGILKEMKTGTKMSRDVRMHDLSSYRTYVRTQLILRPRLAGIIIHRGVQLCYFYFIKKHDLVAGQFHTR